MRAEGVPLWEIPVLEQKVSLLFCVMGPVIYRICATQAFAEYGDKTLRPFEPFESFSNFALCKCR